uniref:Uncharacterized protein n=1 Tax=Ananas comosus var. bracteatus TaxID=296719 RepID=A0A6V7PG93_ANACO|nr:unnamed protein product [Ananas comosus var. bracteatus]
MPMPMLEPIGFTADAGHPPAAAAASPPSASPSPPPPHHHSPHPPLLVVSGGEAVRIAGAASAHWPRNHRDVVGNELAASDDVAAFRRAVEEKSLRLDVVVS